MDLTTTKKYPGGTLTITKHPAHGTERHQHSIGNSPRELPAIPINQRDEE